MQIYDKLFLTHQKILASKPVILNLTNYVTQDFMANILLALGCAPIMSESTAELAELIALANAVSINIGTFDESFHERAIMAAKLSRHYNKPLVLDPVGAGASHSRTSIAREIANYADIIRGNASEIIALADSTSFSNGVESQHQTQDAVISAKHLASKFKNVIVVSGAVDLVVANANNYESNCGHILMTKITGVGCSLSALIAAFASAEPDYAVASYLALLYYTLCAEQAGMTSFAPASFRTTFIDSIYQPNWDLFASKLKYVNGDFL